jgi:RNA polymerase sigma factor for flagellar operon FliA
MKHDHKGFSAAAAAYGKSNLVEDRVRRFMPMVRKAAWHINGNGRDGLEIEDLMQAGFIALTEAARNHVGPGEDGFAAYAKIRVRGAMFDCVRRTMPESRGTIRRRRQLDETQGKLRQELGRSPTPQELAARLGIAAGDLAAWWGEEVQLTPLDESYDDRSSHFASDLPDPFAVLCEMQDNVRLGQAMEVLPDRLKLVLQLYFVEELNLTEIAEVLEVSVPRVHQLKTQALVKLRDLVQQDAG